MPTYTDEGVVLRTIKLGEADRIVTIMTKSHGKIRAVAKGARRTKSRFGGRLEPFARNKFLIHEGRGELQHINQADTIHAYGGEIIADYDAYVCANVIAESLDKFLDSTQSYSGFSSHYASSTQEYSAQGVYVQGTYAQTDSSQSVLPKNGMYGNSFTDDLTAYYNLLVAALGSLARKEHSAQMIESSFLLRMLAMAGWAPRLDNCVVCGRQTDLRFFSTQSGGMMCSTDRVLDAREISKESRIQMYALLHGRWDLLRNNDHSDISPHDGGEQEGNCADPDDSRTFTNPSVTTRDVASIRRDVASNQANNHSSATFSGLTEETGLNPDVPEIVEEWSQYYIERPIRSFQLVKSVI
ncbi:DNA repair protein RecO [Alloscardovia theropitheci]|uniref:DNA repair protein RecO n=1 Tax=Alloscardovia theropitheci TaxID=2496842 RepID=A0A4R0QSC8_9BIFI|nr:DNA repair protein RecO [Alloscardovia theropitheci]